MWKYVAVGTAIIIIPTPMAEIQKKTQGIALMSHSVSYIHQR